jgi:hypothetical protein
MGLCASTNSRSNSPNPRSKVTEDAIEDAAKEAKKVSTPVKQMERGLEQQNGSSKDGIGTHLALLRGTGAPPETQSFHDHGLSLLTHKHEYILHSNDRPLSISFTCPPHIDASVILQYQKENSKWTDIKNCTQIKSRPLAEKLVIIVTFPNVGKYQLFLKVRKAEKTDLAVEDYIPACKYTIQASKKTFVPVKTDSYISPKKSPPARVKSAKHFRATSLSRVDSAASTTGYSLRSKGSQSNKAVNQTAKGRRSIMYETETVERSAATKFGVQKFSHNVEEIIHDSNKPLIITLTSPPRIECKLIMRLENQFAGTEEKTKKTEITDGVTFHPRPMAHKMKIILKFPNPGKYDLRVFCREADNDFGEFSLTLKYSMVVSKETVDESSSGKSKAGERSPGMHLSDKKKIESNGRRETKMSLW